MKSHDVRKMHECSLCGGIGFYRLPDCAEGLLVVAVSSGVYAHPRCYRLRRGLDKLLALPTEELGTIRLCDVSAPTMKAIMQERAHLAGPQSATGLLRPCAKGGK
jgi:hypothetical protein